MASPVATPSAETRPLRQPRARVRRRTRNEIGPGDAAIGNPTSSPSASALAISVSHAPHCTNHRYEAQRDRVGGRGLLSNCFVCLSRLWSWVGVGSSVDVGVPEVRGALLLHRWPRSTWPTFHRGAIGIDREAIGPIADVVPHRRAVAAGRHRVDIVAEELGGEPVLAGGARVASGAAVQFTEDSG